jgi:hypothetical protein
MTIWVFDLMVSEGTEQDRPASVFQKKEKPGFDDSTDLQ